MKFFEFFDFCSLVDLLDHIISQVFVRNFRFFSYRIIEFFSNGLKISCIYQNIITCNPRCWVFAVVKFSQHLFIIKFEFNSQKYQPMRNAKVNVDLRYIPDNNTNSRPQSRKTRKKTFTIFDIGSASPLQPSIKFLVGIFGVPFTFQFVHQISIAYTPTLLNFDNSFFFIIVIFFIFYHLGEDDGSKF